MVFEPPFIVSEKLLRSIKKIAVTVAELNRRVLPKTVVATFEQLANSVSAHASTSIEGNPLSLTQVKRIIKASPDHVRNTEREVLNYNRILEDLNQQLCRGSLSITIDFICRVQRQVTAGLIERHRCGKLRTEPVFVNDPRSGNPIYLPPDHQDVAPLMKELLHFIRAQRTVLDPLIVAGIAHKQFVIIHPFVDGNGRTARLLTKALLADMGLNTFSLFSFENYYNQNVTRYFQSVGCTGNYYDLVEKIDFTEWLEYFADGIIDELLRVQRELEHFVVGPDDVLQPHHQKLLQYIAQHGFATDHDYAKLTSRAKATRALDFKKLRALGLIERFGRGRATHYKLKG